MVLFCLILGGLFGFLIFFSYILSWQRSLKRKKPQPCHSSITKLSSPLVLLFFLLNAVSVTITTLMFRTRWVRPNECHQQTWRYKWYLLTLSPAFSSLDTTINNKTVWTLEWEKQIFCIYLSALNLYSTPGYLCFGAVTVPKTERSGYEHHTWHQGKVMDIYFSKCAFEELISLMSVCEISFWLRSIRL